MERLRSLGTVEWAVEAIGGTTDLTRRADWKDMSKIEDPDCFAINRTVEKTLDTYKTLLRADGELEKTTGDYNVANLLRNLRRMLQIWYRHTGRNYKLYEGCEPQYLS
ncbi:unnamed protein product [Didymodactylos carnosus]|uniref:Uncharacterized protein n=1 Tax=Didymodactylos carnosus TaxID=1234261 RepID=A0A813SPG3_9BILA|nr:unnamed protein product [Didymodactylos carnosus]CAF0899053.1 unnamed protein product [Didymodactylos carnosus]CAF3583568.1 unnamed protein product [Didymodactylos carnosus]CAF3680121.1 unnamed protein product [Didymodactylos carnosus]